MVRASRGDFKEAMKWFRVADPNAWPTDRNTNLGVIYINGQGMAKPDLRRGVAWLNLATPRATKKPPP